MVERQAFHGMCTRLDWSTHRVKCGRTSGVIPRTLALTEDGRDDAIQVPDLVGVRDGCYEKLPPSVMQFAMYLGYKGQR